MMIRPPKLPQRILLRFLRDDLAEEVLGDLDEKFYATLKTRSRFRARLNYAYQVMHYARPFALRKSKRAYLNHCDMFQNYFKIGWRSLLRQKMYSSIKIAGFAIGVTACLLIALFVRQELSYDQHYKNGDRVYRVTRGSSWRGEFHTGIDFPLPFADMLRAEYPEFEVVGSMNPYQNAGSGGNEVRRVEKQESTHETGFTYFDQGMVDVLELSFIMGDRDHALTEPNTMIISRRIADKLFTNEDPVGKSLVLNNDKSREYKITGVIADFPTTSHMQYDFMISLADREFWPGERSNWGAMNYLSYVRVKSDTDPHIVSERLHAVSKNYFLPYAVKEGANKDAMDWYNSIVFGLQPVRDIYLNSERIGDDFRHGDVRYIWLFGAIAVFILLIACINFINLSTARSAGRAREVGLRKVVGSYRSGLIKQFLTESVLFSFCSFVLGAVLAWALLPYFNILLAKTLIFPWAEWWFLPAFGAGSVVIGILAGLYPAFYLSAFRPAQVLKGNLGGRGNSTTRSVLVVFQFAVSILLITGTVVIYRQMNFILTKNLGFNKDQVLLLQGTRTLEDKIMTFKDELAKLSDVKSVTVSGFIPVAGTNRNGSSIRKEGMSEDQSVTTQFWAVDYDYIKTFGLSLSEGRDFLPGMASDSQAVIINKTLAGLLNLKNPVGATVNSYRGKNTIIGVVNDFHFESMRERIGGMMMFIEPSHNSVAIKLDTDDMQHALGAVTTLWKKFSPNQPIRYTFLDQSYARMYDDVQRMGRIFTSFALLAILVACLGLFALSAFTVEQRGKEISIRLVLGASLKNIFNMLTFNFLKLVMFSLFIAIPLSWYLMQKWLEDFSYKIPITWDVFAIAGVMAIAIAFVTISYQSIRAALAKPVDGLKNE